MKEHNYNQRVKRPVIYRPREAKETYGAVEALKSNDEEALTFIAQGLVAFLFYWHKTLSNGCAHPCANHWLGSSLVLCIMQRLF